MLGYVVGPNGQYHLKDAAQKTVLFELQRQDDGDWKLKDGHEALLYKVKTRDYGFEVEGADEKGLAKAKTKAGKVVLRDASDKTLFSSPLGGRRPAADGLPGFRKGRRSCR